MSGHEQKSESVLPEREQEILDTALLESDQLLARSLHDDERRRWHRRLGWLSLLVIGGAVMSAVILIMLFANPDVERAEALAAEGWQLWQKRELIEAADKFAEAVDLNPSAANAWNGYGWTLFNSGQNTKALRAFEQCVELSPKHPAGLNGLGQLYLAHGKLDEAEKYLKKSARNPHASAAWVGLTRVYLLRGEFKKALPWAKKLAKVSDDEYHQKLLAAAEAGELNDELRAIIAPVVDDEDDKKGEDESPHRSGEEATRESAGETK